MAISLTESYLRSTERSAADDGMHWSLGSAPYKPLTDEYSPHSEASHRPLSADVAKHAAEVVLPKEVDFQMGV